MNIKETNLSNRINIKELLSTYTKRWFWFLLSTLLTVGIAFVYLRYATPQYGATAKIQILEEKDGSTEMAAFKEIDFLSGGENKVEDEIQLLNSRANFIEVVRRLGINVKYTVVGKITDSEIYKKVPIKLNFLVKDSVLYASNFTFFIKISSTTTYGYAESMDEKMKVYTYGDKIETSLGGIVITPSIFGKQALKNKIIRVNVSPIWSVAQSYKGRVSIFPSKSNSNIVNLSLNSSNKLKAHDVLNELISVYNENAIEDKKIISNRTITFINDRIKNIATNLSDVDKTAQDFKTGNRITDIASEANINLNFGAANEQELASANTQLSIASSMKDLVDDNNDYDILPSNIGLSDPSVGATTAKYNELVSERNRMLKTLNTKNPMIVSLDQQIDGLRENMRSSLNSTTNNLSIQVGNLRNQQSRINYKIYSAPKQERQLRDITRKQQTTESLYLYLLQKREESGITLASSSPKSKIIDFAYSASQYPISPKRSIVLLASLIIGLLIPFSIIYIKDLLDDKIHSKIGLEKIVANIPILAEIPKIKQNQKEGHIIAKNDRSVLAESLRIFRTNLDYLIKTKSTDDNPNNVVYITSTVSGEGKTFVSTNLAMIFANTGKKVLLIGGDIRNPKLFSFLKTKSFVDGDKIEKTKEIGLTEYLYDKNVTAPSIIKRSKINDTTLDVIYSGKIPPNPSELLMSDRLGELISSASKEYDYVIVDTAPLMVVTDTLLMAKHANHIVYVTRAGVTEKKVINFPLDMHEQGKIDGLSFIVNDVKSSDLGYGGKYGYGYGTVKKKWWKRS